MSADKSRLANAMKPRRDRPVPVAKTFLGAEGVGEPAPRKGEVGGEVVQTSVRLPADLHKKARYASIEEGVSLNSLIVEGLALRLGQ